ncbi:MAG: DNA cytosine methyltransferase [Candidatus Binatia bacterium]
MTRLAHYKKNRNRCGGQTGLQYRVVSRILDAADYGIPQKRERVFIVGFRSDLETEWNIPPATHSEEALIWSQTYENDYWDRHSVARIERGADYGNARAGRPPSRSRPTLKPWRTVRDAIADLPDPELDPRSATEYPNDRFSLGRAAMQATLEVRWMSPPRH